MYPKTLWEQFIHPICVHSSWAPLPSVLAFCVALIPEEGCISLTEPGGLTGLRDSSDVAWALYKFQTLIFPKISWHSWKSGLWVEWNAFRGNITCPSWGLAGVSFLLFFTFYSIGLLHWSCVSPQAGNKTFMEKGYDLKIWCSGQSCQKLKHYFQLPSANDFHPFFPGTVTFKVPGKGLQDYWKSWLQRE